MYIALRGLQCVELCNKGWTQALNYSIPLLLVYCILPQTGGVGNEPVCCMVGLAGHRGTWTNQDSLVWKTEGHKSISGKRSWGPRWNNSCWHVGSSLYMHYHELSAIKLCQVRLALQFDHLHGETDHLELSDTAQCLSNF